MYLRPPPSDQKIVMEDGTAHPIWRGWFKDIRTVTGIGENFIWKLGSASINAKTLTKQTIYSVAKNKVMIPYAVCIRSLSASLAGMTDMDIGGNAGANDWLQQISLNAFTATTDYGLIMQPEQAVGPPIVPVKKTVYAADTAFGVLINVASTGAATFTIDLLGYLI